eukprot:17351-Eustigmatos_ZCMA.PRE.1
MAAYARTCHTAEYRIFCVVNTILRGVLDRHGDACDVCYGLSSFAQDGRIAEMGSHDELVTQRSLYASLWARQGSLA